MGVGHYTEQDVREAARAFTGWNFANLDFVVHTALHDDEPKTFLGADGQLRRRRRAQHHPRAAGDGRLHLDQDLPLLRARRRVTVADVRARCHPARQRVRGAAAAADDAPVAGLLQRCQLRRPHQGSGRARDHDAEAPGHQRRARRARLQQHHDRAGPAPAEPAPRSPAGPGAGRG